MGEQKAQQKMHYALREANDDCHKASDGGKGSVRRKLLEENKVSVNSKDQDVAIIMSNTDHRYSYLIFIRIDPDGQWKLVVGPVRCPEHSSHLTSVSGKSLGSLKNHWKRTQNGRFSDSYSHHQSVNRSLENKVTDLHELTNPNRLLDSKSSINSSVWVPNSFTVNVPSDVYNDISKEKTTKRTSKRKGKKKKRKRNKNFRASANECSTSESCSNNDVDNNAGDAIITCPDMSNLSTPSFLEVDANLKGSDCEDESQSSDTETLVLNGRVDESLIEEIISRNDNHSKVISDVHEGPLAADSTSVDCSDSGDGTNLCDGSNASEPPVYVAGERGWRDTKFLGSSFGVGKYSSRSREENNQMNPSPRHLDVPLKEAYIFKKNSSADQPNLWSKSEETNQVNVKVSKRMKRKKTKGSKQGNCLNAHANPNSEGNQISGIMAHATDETSHSLTISRLGLANPEAEPPVHGKQVPSDAKLDDPLEGVNVAASSKSDRNPQNQNSLSFSRSFDHLKQPDVQEELSPRHLQPLAVDELTNVEKEASDSKQQKDMKNHKEEHRTQDVRNQSTDGSTRQPSIMPRGEGLHVLAHNSSEGDWSKAARAVNDAYDVQPACEAVEMASGIPIANFERFLHSASPSICCFRDKPVSLSHCRDETPDLSLESVWEWYEKPGNYGLEVRAEDYETAKRLGTQCSTFSAYFVPLLSAVQLFRYNNKSYANPSPSSPNQDGACSHDPELLFEYFEFEQPPQRRPLYEMIKELVKGEKPLQYRAYGDPTKLHSLKLHDLHPKSWYSVAWYPIYRIPEGNFRASFLTYHSLGHFAHATGACIVLPVVGLQSYNIQGECWFQPRHFDQSENGDFGPGAILKKRLRTLEETASLMARDVVSKGGVTSPNKHPDFEFFLSRKRQW